MVSTVPLSIQTLRRYKKNSLIDTLRRNGVEAGEDNAMQVDLDMNSNKILNVLTDLDDPTSLVTRDAIYSKEEVEVFDSETLSAAKDYADSLSIGVVASESNVIALTGDPLVDLTTGTSYVRSANGSVFYVSGPLVDGERLVLNEDYEVTSPSKITLLSTFPAGTKLVQAYFDTPNSDSYAALSDTPLVPSTDIAKASQFKIGDVFFVQELGGARFEVQSPSTPLLVGDLELDSGYVAKLQPTPDGLWNILHFGATPNNTSTVYQDEFQGAVDRGIAFVPKGDYTVESLTIPSGHGILGEHRSLTRIFKSPDTEGHLVYSPAPTDTSNRHIRLENFTLHGNRALFTSEIQSDGVHIEGSGFEAESVLGKSVWCRAMTGSGWYIGPERNIPELYDCYGFDVDGHGLQVNSASDLIAVHCGFGSAGGNSVLVGTSATPVFIGCEIWWANGNASVNLYQNTTFMLIGCNLDRGRNGVVRVVGRVGVDDRHENGFINGCTFLGPRGVNGNGSDGDLNFIDLINTRGVNIVGNNFESTPSNGTDVLVDYIVSISGVVENVGWTGNNYSTDSRKPYLTDVYNEPGPFNTKLINLEARRAVFGSPNSTAVEMGRSTFGKVTRYKLDDIEYGAMAVRANGLRLTGTEGVTINHSALMRMTVQQHLMELLLENATTIHQDSLR